MRRPCLHSGILVALMIGTGPGLQPQSLGQPAWSAVPSLNVARELFGVDVDECGNIWAAGETFLGVGILLLTFQLGRR